MTSHIACLERLEGRILLSTLNIQFDYTYDTHNFFNTQAKKDLLQQAANVFETTIAPNLTAIQPSGGNSWSETFTNPGTGISQVVNNPTVPANTIVIYVGGRALHGAELGDGGPGGYNANGDNNWLDTVAARGVAGALSIPKTAFSPWGGAITFDTNGGWFFGSTTSGLASPQTDFLSVVTHELTHLLGFGTSDAFTALISNGFFTGSNSVASHGGNVPISADMSHWAASVTSNGQEPVMSPSIATGVRKTMTPLDFAGLADIGWTVYPQVRMYRTYNPFDNYHFFTTSQAEFGYVVTVQHFNDETSGRAGFNVLSGPVQTAIPIHRLYDQFNGEHYYTTSDGERDSLVAHGWNYERDEGAIYPTQAAGSTEIFMLYNNQSGEHLFTENAGTANAIVTQFPGIWVQQTSLGFGYAVAAPSIATSSNSPGSAQTGSVAAPFVTAAETSSSAVAGGASSSATISQAINVGASAGAVPTNDGVSPNSANAADASADECRVLRSPLAPSATEMAAAERVWPPTSVRRGMPLHGLDTLFAAWPETGGMA